ncbi:hypothetical protein ACSMX9_11590 [Streptomyces sp. LE64]|uniref:hypothetical protein n=1 Tax=Streptomyces sp. LE64 TaxID=3448653 RepID=UPI0040426309
MTIKRSGSEVDAKVTEAGTFYIQHGHHPDDPAHAGEKKTAKGKAAGSTRSASYADRPVALARRIKAKELIGRLVTGRRVTFTEPDDATVSEWRGVIDYAKRHSLVPEHLDLWAQYCLAGPPAIVVRPGLRHHRDCVAAALPDTYPRGQRVDGDE